MKFEFRSDYTIISPRLTVRPPDRSIDLFEIDSSGPFARIGGITFKAEDIQTGVIATSSFSGDAPGDRTGIRIDGPLESGPLTVTPAPVFPDETKLPAATIGGEDEPRFRFRHKDTVSMGSFGDSAGLAIGPRVATDATESGLGGKLFLFNRFADMSVHADADTASLRIGSEEPFDPTVFDDSDSFGNINWSSATDDGGDEATTSGSIDLGDGGIVLEAVSAPFGDDDDDDDDEPSYVIAETGASITMDEDRFTLDGSGTVTIDYWESDEGATAQLHYEAGALSFITPYTAEYHGPTVSMQDGNGDKSGTTPALYLLSVDNSSQISLRGDSEVVRIEDTSGPIGKQTSVSVEDNTLRCRIDETALVVTDDSGEAVFELTTDALTIHGDLTVGGSLGDDVIDE